jgi:HEPN domain-containing protein
MPEYNLGFSEKLIDAARLVVDEGLDSVDAKRTVLYISSLSCEITLKALLEKAGQSVKKIKAHGHDLSELLKEIGECEVQEEIVNGSLSWVRATSLRGVTVDERYGNATVGTLLTAEEHGASKYPNQMRYSDYLDHYPPELMFQAANALLSWAHDRWDRIRCQSSRIP